MNKIKLEWKTPASNAHLKGREELVWFSRNGGRRVKNMSNEHIINTKNMIDRKTKDNPLWCGHHKKEWDYIFDEELRFREREGIAFMNTCREIFPNSTLLKDLKINYHD